MNTLVIGIMPQAILVQYQEGDRLERKYISRRVVNTSVKNQILDLPAHILRSGIDYSNVDWPGLGEKLKLDITELEQAMRRAGLWTSEDYRKNPEIVKKVLSRSKLRAQIDPTTVLNLAQGVING